MNALSEKALGGEHELLRFQAQLPKELIEHFTPRPAGHRTQSAGDCFNCDEKYCTNNAPMAVHLTRRLRKIGGENHANTNRESPMAPTAISRCLISTQNATGLKIFPAKLSLRLVNGSGRWLANSRVAALDEWLVKATPPQSSAISGQVTGSSLLANGGAGKNRSRGPDEGVDGVPEAVHARNLVGQELG